MKRRSRRPGVPTAAPTRVGRCGRTTRRAPRANSKSRLAHRGAGLATSRPSRKAKQSEPSSSERLVVVAGPADVQRQLQAGYHEWSTCRTLSRRFSMFWLVRNSERNSSTWRSRSCTRSACFFCCRVKLVSTDWGRHARCWAYPALVCDEVGLRRRVRRSRHGRLELRLEHGDLFAERRSEA